MGVCVRQFLMDTLETHSESSTWAFLIRKLRATTQKPLQIERWKLTLVAQEKHTRYDSLQRLDFDPIQVRI